MHRLAAHLALVLLLLSGSMPLWARPAAPPHEYHVCITEMQHNPVSGKLEITVKIFTDDIERSILKMGGEDLRLGTAQESARADAVLLQYLHNRLNVTIDDKNSELVWVGKEVELDAVYCYVEAEAPKPPHSIAVTNRILTELFDDQANMVHITCANLRKSLMLDKTTLSGTVFF